MDELSAEIAAFDEACRCTDDEIQARQKLLDDIARVVRDIWGNKAAVKAFGSFVTQTSAHNSDLDVVVTGLVNPTFDGELSYAESLTANRCLSQLMAKLSSTLRAMQHIRQARIPVLKGTSIRNGIKVDISVGTDSGVHTAETMNQHFNTHRHARPLLRVLKAMLKYNNLHEVYTGGLSSFSLSNMVVAHLLQEQHLAAARGEVPPDTTGQLLMLFLKLYGRTFNYERSAVSVRQGGIVSRDSVRSVAISRRSYYDDSSDMRIVVEDPVTGRDVAGGTFRMHVVCDVEDRVGPWDHTHATMQVKSVFSNALSSLERAIKAPVDATKSSYPLLSSVFVVQAMLGRAVDYNAVPPPTHAGFKRKYAWEDKRWFGDFGGKDSNGDTTDEEELEYQYAEYKARKERERGREEAGYEEDEEEAGDSDSGSSYTPSTPESPPDSNGERPCKKQRV